MTPAYNRLIDGLAADLPPVRRLWSPWIRAVFWMVCTVAIGLLLVGPSEIGVAVGRFAAAADLGCVAAGAALAAFLGAVAACLLCLPDRSPAWAWLPVPGVLIWLFGSVLGCMRPVAVPGLPPASAIESLGCGLHILGAAVPFAALLLVMVRRAAPLRPRLTYGIAGVAAAFGGLTALCFDHPFSTTPLDAGLHGAAMAVVIGVCCGLSRAGLKVRPFNNL